MNFDEKAVDRIKKLEREVERLRVKESGKFIALTTPLTSTSWDGNAYSTVGKTLIDLSSVFGTPAGIKAVDIYLECRDSGSAATGTCVVILAPTDTKDLGKAIHIGYQPNNSITTLNSVIPCDANGDIYYQIYASGTGTMTVKLQIWGYWL